MEPTNKSSIVGSAEKKDAIDSLFVEFLPDADEIERSPVPRLAQSTLYVLMIAFLIFLLWAIFSEVDRVVVARGKLITPLPNIIVQPLETSIIQSLDVRVGQVVMKDERLATLDPTFAEADQTQLSLRLNSLNTQYSRLKAELAGLGNDTKKSNNQDDQLQAQLDLERKANYKAQQKQLSEKIGQLRAAINTNQQDQRALIARIKPLQEIEEMQNQLVAKQYGSRVQMLEAREKRMEVDRDFQFAKNREQELTQELLALEAEKSAFDKGWRQKAIEDLLTTKRERDEVNEMLQKAEKRHKLVNLTAPVNSVVLDIAKLSVGSVVREAEPLFTLVPIGSELEAEVQIESLDVGYIKLGDASRIKFDAYPFQKHGTLDAKVRTISEDAFRRESGGQGIDVYYLGRIELANSKLNKMPDYARLLPGMTITAEIVVGKRSVISYLLWPLTKALDESIREP